MILYETHFTKSCTFFYFIYNEPPLLNLPVNHHDVIHFQIHKTLFTWTPRHSNATNIECRFTLIELIDNQSAFKLMRL
jgi:hypothetical protein